MKLVFDSQYKPDNITSFQDKGIVELVIDDTILSGFKYRKVLDQYMIFACFDCFSIKDNHYFGLEFPFILADDDNLYCDTILEDYTCKSGLNLNGVNEYWCMVPFRKSNYKPDRYISYCKLYNGDQSINYKINIDKNLYYYISYVLMSIDNNDYPLEDKKDYFTHIDKNSSYSISQTISFEPLIAWIPSKNTLKKKKRVIIRGILNNRFIIAIPVNLTDESIRQLISNRKNINIPIISTDVEDIIKLCTVDASDYEADMIMVDSLKYIYQEKSSIIHMTKIMCLKYNETDNMSATIDMYDNIALNQLMEKINKILFK